MVAKNNRQHLLAAAVGSTLSLLLLCGVIAPVSATTSDLVITEFLASNDAGLVDEDGESSDWLEIHNSGASPVNLVGLTLTDDATVPNAERWAFPSVELAPMAYLVVFASGEDRRMDDGSELHTDFRLGAGGEYLGLADATGDIISEYSPEYPPQSSDVSYGIDSTGNLRFFSTPTPGVANGVGDPQRVEAVVTSSIERGFYDAAIAVELGATSSTASPLMTGLEIRYTTNGSEPTATSGTVYTRSSGSIVISTTTVLRAAAFAENSLPSPTSTYTYVFLADVLQQPATIPGFPNGILQDTGNMGLPVAQDFAMDPAIVAQYSGEIMQAMKSIPSISISAPTDDIFDVYLSDDDIETRCSMEVLSAVDPSQNEQIDVGLESHSWNRQKRSLRLNFRSDYGNREWVTPFFKNNAPLNSESVIDTHRTLILRAGSNRSWARSREPNEVAYTIDEFFRASQIAMTGVGSHGTFVHLYLNGAYWGVYNLVERPDDEFQAEYFGGSDDNYFYTNHGGAGSADSTRWDYLIGPLARKDLTDAVNYAEMEEYLNLESFADYLILSFWIGLSDWPDNNWYVANRNDASPLGPTASIFFAWDGEFSLDRTENDEPLDGIRKVPETGGRIPYDFIYDSGSSEPILVLWHALFATDDFKALFDERVQFHTGAGAAMSDDAAIQRWDTLNDYVRSAIIGESARWGDALQSLSEEDNIFSVSTRTRDVDWQIQVDKIRDLLEGNTQQFLEEYSKLVNPSKFSRIIAKFPALRNFFAWLDGRDGLFSKWF